MADLERARELFEQALELYKLERDLTLNDRYVGQKQTALHAHLTKQLAAMRADFNAALGAVLCPGVCVSEGSVCSMLEEAMLRARKAERNYEQALHDVGTLGAAVKLAEQERVQAQERAEKAEAALAAEGGVVGPHDEIERIRQTVATEQCPQRNVCTHVRILAGARDAARAERQHEWERAEKAEAVQAVKATDGECKWVNLCMHVLDTRDQRDQQGQRADRAEEERDDWKAQAQGKRQFHTGVFNMECANCLHYWQVGVGTDGKLTGEDSSKTACPKCGQDYYAQVITWDGNPDIPVAVVLQADARKWCDRAEQAERKRDKAERKRDKAERAWAETADRLVEAQAQRDRAQENADHWHKRWEEAEHSVEYWRGRCGERLP